MSHIVSTAVFFGLKTVNNFDTWHLQQDRSSKPMELLIGLDLVQRQGDAFKERAKLILRGWGHVILSGVRSWYLFRSTMLATFELESRSARKVSCISIRSSTILPLQSSIIYTFLFELPYVDNTFNFPHFWHHHCIRSIITMHQVPKQGWEDASNDPRSPPRQLSVQQQVL